MYVAQLVVYPNMASDPIIWHQDSPSLGTVHGRKRGGRLDQMFNFRLLILFVQHRASLKERIQPDKYKTCPYQFLIHFVDCELYSRTIPCRIKHMRYSPKCKLSATETEDENPVESHRVRWKNTKQVQGGSTRWQLLPTYASVRHGCKTGENRSEREPYNIIYIIIT